MQKIRKIIILLKYGQEYKRIFKTYITAHNIIGHKKVNFDKNIKWNSTDAYYINFPFYSTHY
jgi:hypothetical protein